MDGCYGEVKLAEHASYKKWGIEIKVRFRTEADGGKVAVLNKLVHSGGERSVSTILFLMALQVMPRVVSAFLCVTAGLFRQQCSSPSDRPVSHDRYRRCKAVAHPPTTLYRTIGSGNSGLPTMLCLAIAFRQQHSAHHPFCRGRLG